MIQTGIDARVKVQDIVSSQLPNFILDEASKTVDFLKQYYISQEYQGGVIDIAENLDQYLDLDNLTPEVVTDTTSLSVGIGTQEEDIVTVSSTKGFPNKYGLLKIDDEILTYTGLTTNTFTGLTRGFSGITSYHADLNREELVFSTSNAGVHTAGSNIQNLSTLFLKEFYKKFKSTFAPGFEQLNFDKNLKVGNFLKEIKSFYESKGTDAAIETLFRVLYGVDPKIINLEELLVKPSAAEYLRREVVIVEVLSGNPLGLVGQTIKKIEKLNDPSTQASVSEVESFFRDGKRYYKFSLFIGYDGTSLVEGNFKITPNTKTVETISVGSSTISVDSTIGFSTTGNIISGINTVSYTDKTINQFLGCTGITSSILPTSNIYSDEIYFGFEGGDKDKRVEFRITGILSGFRQLSQSVNVSEGDIIKVKNIGQNIKNPDTKTTKEVFANSWIYNTSASYDVESIDGTIINLKSELDRSSLKKGDFVEFVEISDPSLVVYPTPTDNSPYVQGEVIKGSKSITLGNFSGVDPAFNYKIRKKLNKAKSNFVPIDGDITSDISNIYFDRENGYAASNSLPSAINSNIPNTKFFENINTKLNKLTLNSVENQDVNTKLYSQIKVNETDLVKILRTGDAVFYQSSGSELEGLPTGLYYIEIFNDSAQLIKLYSSRSFIDSGTAVEFGEPVAGDVHSFTLFSQRSNLIKPRKLLKKFPITPNLKNGGVSETIPGTTGILINGVEIFNYKTNDKVFFGPLSQVNIISSGTDYDVINPPQIGISTGSGSGAVIQPVIKGSLVDAFVDAQELGIAKVVSIGITGGNGSGAVIAPVIGKRSRELTFSASGITTANRVGIDTFGTITFPSAHNFEIGESVIYDSLNGTSIGNPITALVSKETYFVSIPNDRTVKLHLTENDARSGINTIGLSARSGTQKFIVGNPQDTILDLKILNSGSNYSNRTLSISTAGISTFFNSITFENHGFNTGDNIVYSTTGTAIEGLDTNIQYKILKINQNEFGLANAGLGGTDSTNFEQSNFVSFTTSGIGTQTFKYPDIKASIEYIQVGGAKTTATIRGELEITPVVRGGIDDILLTDKGTGYGSQILNFEKKPNIKIKNGKNAEVRVTIDATTTGISSVSVAAAGTEYFSTPSLEVIDTSGLGNGARLKAVLGKTSTGELNGKIDNVVIIRSGIGYSADSTSVRVIPAGQNGVLAANVRSLNVNNTEKYGKRVNSLEENLDSLQNVVCGYSTAPFQDNGSNVSPIIGWAYDGNPIYGPYGFTDPEKKTNDTKLLQSSYTLNINSIENRPSTDVFPEGFFVEDFQYTGDGDLDEHNGRFEINNDYPQGVYAYHATINSAGISTFPYFIGNKFRSIVESDNFVIDQSFDFVNSELRRNTFPYKVSDPNAGTDSLTETNEITTQLSEIETVEGGSVQSLQILNGGTNHKVGEVLDFDNTDTEGGGIIARVKSVKGVGINSVTSDSLTYNNSVITKLDNKTLKITPRDNHNLNNNDKVVISGLTSSLTAVNGTYTVGVSSLTAVAISTISAGTATTEIYISEIPENVSVGNTIGIGSETLKILNIYAADKILTVQRSLPAIAHTASTPLHIIPDSFTINKSVPDFNSKVNDKFFFNPSKTIGFGQVSGITTSVIYGFGDGSRTNTIPQQGIYLENHPFKQNQKISFNLPTATSTNIGISTTPTGSIITLPSEIFVVRKNSNVIGIKTGIGTDPTLTGNKEYSEVFFRGTVGGDGNIDSDLYFFESNFVQEKVNVSNIKTTVSLASSVHNLKDGDDITLKVEPNLSTGIGTLTEVNVKRDTTTNKILIDPVEGLTTGIKLFNDATGANEITLKNHNLTTGDKIIYYSTHYAVGLGNSSYYVSVIDDNTFKLCQTYQNAISNPPVEIDITAAAGITTIHRLSKVNPSLKSIKNNDLVFNLSDVSLLNHKFKVYYDNKFENEFVSTSSTTGFNTPVGIVTEGTTNSKFTIGYGVSLPEKLYYNLEKVGIALTADVDVKNYSEIEYIDSVFDGKYTISNVGVSSFTIDVNNVPERTFYTSTQCDFLEYSTTSGLATGSINSVDLVSGGFNYKKLPSFVGVGTTTTQDAIIIPRSTTIGNIKKTRVINEGFEYSSDKTLQPEALIPKFIELTGSDAISSVEVIDGGSGFTKPPSLLVIDTDNGKSVDGLLSATLNGSSINNVDIISSPTGLSKGEVKLVTTDNTNGISIQKVDANAGISTYVISITKPAGGYPVNPFKSGDSVFVEGIVRVGTAGSGFNSSDYGFNFLPVTNYDTSGVFDKITVDVSQYTTNVGLAQTIQSSFGVITNANLYPKFKLNLERSRFTVGEKLLVNNFERDLTVVENFQDSFIKVIGLFDLQENDIIVGKKSKNRGRIEKVTNNQGDFIISYSLVRDFGWESNTGKLNEDNQVIANNDYYQNLSYSIQSPIEWNKLESPVNNLVHTVGTKNFADTGITSTTQVSIATSDQTVITRDVVEQLRVDTLFNFDQGRDTFVGLQTNTSEDAGEVDTSKSKFIQLKNTRLTDFTEADTNNVISIDDISSKFSSVEGEPTTEINVTQINPVDSFNSILVMANNLDGNQISLSELVVLNNNQDVSVLNKLSLLKDYNVRPISGAEETLTHLEDENFANFELATDQLSDGTKKTFLRFKPTDANKFKNDYDLKIFENKFNTTITGIGTSSFGLIDISSSVVGVGTTSDVAGTTESIISNISTTNVDSLFVQSQIIDQITNDVEYVETFITHNGTDTFKSQQIFDTSFGNLSFGLSTATISPDISGGALSVNINNVSDNNLKVRSKILSFGPTSSGISSYRFKASGQSDGSERTALVASNFSQGTGTARNVATFEKDKFTALKSTVHVGTGTSEALHQVLLIHDQNTSNIVQSQFLSVGDNTGSSAYDNAIGLGTFVSRFSGNNILLDFHPDNTTGVTTIKSLNEVFYRAFDELTLDGEPNEPNDLTFGKITQSLTYKQYNAIDGVRVNNRSFKLKNNGFPIFAQSFDPSNTSIVNFVTGTFSIPNHNFRNQEELVYTPKSSFVGVGSTPMMYKPFIGNTDQLPTTVFAVVAKNDNNTFQISTSRDGSAVTFTDAGEGNTHQFEMSKGLTKAVISLDGIVQSPIARSNLTFTLSGNGGSIGVGQTIFRLNSISDLNLTDLLKVDNEIFEVDNVGLGTTNVGPISGTGSIPLVQVSRGAVGTEKATHTDTSSVIVFKGSYNIKDGSIFFTDAPRGDTRQELNESGLPPAKSDFNGRVYFRNDYTSNKVYDDISNQFTGIASVFTLKSGGINTTGAGQLARNGLLFVNNIFQTPSTANNPNQNYKIIDNGSTTTLEFSGITTITDGALIKNETDINQNELPRGGVIVSLGSTGGLGYAPLVPAKVKLLVGTGASVGMVTSVVGVAYSGPTNSISTASYNNNTGILQITTVDKHNLLINGSDDQVILNGLEFACSAPHAGVTTTIFPDGSIGDQFPVVSVSSTNTFKTQVGTSTIPHTYVGSGTVRPWYGDLTFGSGYNRVSIAATVFDPGYNHIFVSAEENSVYVDLWGQNAKTPTDASYDPVTGNLVLFIDNHGLTTSNSIGINTNSIVFSCSKDDYSTNHPYPRKTDPVSGILTSITSFNTNSITAFVGKNVGSGATITAEIGVGGALSFNIPHAGTGYKEPKLFTPSPSYDDMPIVGVSRVGTGATTDTGIGALITVDVGNSGATGIGSTLFSVNNFELSRNGYSFKKGDKFTPVGLVTDGKIPAPLSQFEIEVVETYSDNFSFWQFGELDYIDSISSLQDGSRVNFPLFYNGDLISIESTNTDIILKNLLVIFINGVLQQPDVNYEFEGGTSISFTTAPSRDDNVSIYIYKGQDGVDSIIRTNQSPIVEVGDFVQLTKSDGISTSKAQDQRTVFDLSLKDKFETDLYSEQGIDSDNFRGIHLIKQKRDTRIEGRNISKVRDSIEPQIYPTAKIISDITTSSSTIYVDNAKFFDVEGTASADGFDAKIISGAPLPLVGITTLTATVSTAGTVSGLTITGGGSGYTSAPTISIGRPGIGISVGVGTTATATVTITNGVIDGFAITNPGLGYTIAPQVLVSPPVAVTEGITSVTSVTGFSADITQISVIGSNITFRTKRTDGVGNYTGLGAGDYILVDDTTVGNGVTSLNETGLSVVSIGTTFFDNVYQVVSIGNTGVSGTIVCKAQLIPSDATINTGINTNSNNIGNLSFGKLSSLNRSSTPISIGVTGLTANSGLSTFPTIQRSGGEYTLRQTGALPKII